MGIGKSEEKHNNKELDEKYLEPVKSRKYLGIVTNGKGNLEK